MSGHWIDALRLKLRSPSSATVESWPEGTRFVDTNQGRVRVLDTGSGSLPVIVMTPDGPNVIEHHEVLIRELAPHARVICFDLPGFGFSYPSLGFDFSAASFADAIVTVLDALAVEQATLSFTCANGFLAIAAARRAPERISRLVLAQTPSLSQMRHWVDRVIPATLTRSLIGQIFMAATERRFAGDWYRFALPRNLDREPYRQPALTALRNGGCFCLAGLVQGLASIDDADLEGVEAPATLVWGNRDLTHRKTRFESLREHLPGCEIVKFDGCGHFPDLERPREYAGLLRSSIGDG